jgi:hypothetical protein
MTPLPNLAKKNEKPKENSGQDKSEVLNKVDEDESSSEEPANSQKRCNVAGDRAHPELL